MVAEASHMDRMTIPSDFHLETIATDMDGTFLGTKLYVSQQTKDAYRRAVKMGIPVIPATGRVREGVEQALMVAGVNDMKLYPGVYLNGCTTYGPTGDLIWECFISNHIVHKMVELEKRINEMMMSKPHWRNNPLIKNPPPEHGFYAVRDPTLKPAVVVVGGYSNGGIVCAENNQLTDGMKQFNEGEFRVVGPLDEYVKHHPIHKLLFITHSGDLMKEFRPEMEQLLADEAVINAAVPRIVEISPKGVNKGVALERLANHLGLSLKAVACLGDGDNDEEMLKRCGFSIAMGNATEELKSIAHVTTKSNNENGWAIAVNSLLDRHEEGNHNGTKIQGVPDFKRMN